MKINKLIGYTEIQTNDGIIGIKIGSYTLEKLCEDFGVDLDGMESLLDVKETEIDGEKYTFNFPKNAIKFMASLLSNGANYVSLHNDGKQYSPIQAYDWIDQIGIGSKKFQEILSVFLHAARTGVVLPIEEPQQSEQPKQRKKKASDVVRTP